VGLIVRFVPFSQLINWVSGTPYEERGLSPEGMDIPSFAQEFEIANVPLERISSQPSHRFVDGVGSAAPQGQARRVPMPQAQCAAQGAA
jgi:hypothetical protein